MADQTQAPRGRGRGRGPAVTPEQRAEIRRKRFVKLAAKRVNKALKAMDSVARLANKANYQYTNDEAAKVIGAIREMAEVVINEFTAPTNGKPMFTL